MRRLFKIVPLVLAGVMVMAAVSWLIAMPTREERGVWRSETGVMLLHLTPYTADLYTEVGQSCLQEARFPAHMALVQMLEGAWVERQGEYLHLNLDGALEPIRFTALEALPTTCRRVDAETANARQVFDVMWNAMDQHYAFFDLHGVDWQSRRVLAPDVGVAMDDTALWALLSDALEGLDDGHVHLVSDELGVFSPALGPEWLPEDSEYDREALFGLTRAALDETLTSVANTEMEYALIDDATGYILISEMSVETGWGDTSFVVAREAMAEVLAELGDIDDLIIDVRFNPGGSDSVAFGYASHFVGEATPVFRKAARQGNGIGPWFEAVVPPYDDTPFTGDVVILTTELTGSGAEIFVLAMRDLPNVQMIGRNTGGGLSDVMGITLPNGWAMGLSNQHYVTMAGEAFEAVGIPPGIRVEFSLTEFVDGRDEVLETARQSLSEQQ